MTPVLFFAVLMADPAKVVLTPQDVAAMEEGARVLTQQTDVSLAYETAKRCEEALNVNKGLVAGLENVKRKYKLSILEDKVLFYDCVVYVSGKVAGGLDAIVSAAKPKTEGK